MTELNDLELEYDAWKNLSTVHRTGSNSAYYLQSYVYDHAGRLVAVINHKGFADLWLYDGSNPVEKWRASNTSQSYVIPMSEHLWGPGTQQLLAARTDESNGNLIMEVQELLYQAYLSGGGDPSWLEGHGYSFSGYRRLPPFEELEAKIFEALHEVKCASEIEMIVDLTVWNNLPWSIGEAAFQRMFELGRRDQQFLEAYRDFMSSFGGPDGEIILRGVCEELEEEDNGELCRHLNFSSYG